MEVAKVTGSGGMKRVALVYVRRSIVRYAEHRASPERQFVNCAAVCEEKGA